MNQPKLTIVKDPVAQLWTYMLIEDYEYKWGVHDILVPTGFSYDGATIPSWAWQAIYTPFDPLVMLPALIHDWIYSNHQLTQKEADDLLYDLLRENDVPRATAYTMWVAVRAVGDQWWPNSDEDIAYMRKLYKQVSGSPNLARYQFPPEAVN